jgi:hypothetical protein
MCKIKNILLLCFCAVAIVSCSNPGYNMPPQQVYGPAVSAEADIPIYSNRSDTTTQHSFSQDIKQSGQSSFPSGNGMKQWSQEDKISSFHQETKGSHSGGHFTIGVDGG